MVVGSWLINATLGLIGFVAVFFASYGNNLVTTSLIRGLVSFVSFFILGYLFRWMLTLASKETLKDGNREVAYDKISNEKLEKFEDDEGTSSPFTVLDNDKGELLSEEDILKTTEYVRELMNDKED